MHQRAAFIVLAGALLAGLGCTSYQSSHFAAPALVELPHVSASIDEIRILEQVPPSSDFVAIGKVHAHGRCNWFFGFLGCREKGMKDRLLKEAAQLGAEALIDLKVDRWNQLEWSERHYHATAIRWVRAREPGGERAQGR